ncbi:MAG: hypothetical protein Ta2A_21230 [Treponemataceae bacterium]|nr:MAG: hypothetical protein Ta2A_21230 [Treponemataceae bacterium]
MNNFNFSPLDIFFLLVIVIFAISVASRGLVKELFSKAAFIFGLLSACIMFKTLAASFAHKIPNVYVSHALAFVLIFSAVYVAIRVAELVITRLMQNEIAQGLNHSLGLFLGIAEGCAIVVIFSLLLAQLPETILSQNTLRTSFFYRVATSFSVGG